MSQLHIDCTELIARRYAAAVLRIRANAIEAGSNDEAIQSIIQRANDEFLGNINATGEAALLEAKTALQTAKDAFAAAHAGRQQRINTPHAKALVTELFECLAKASENEKQAAVAERKGAETANILESYGLQPSAIEEVIKREGRLELRHEAERYRQRAAEIEALLKEV